MTKDERPGDEGRAIPTPSSTSSFASTYSSISALPDFDLWDRMKERRAPIAFDLELTARCNNDCRHCYINLPDGDKDAQAKELPLAEIERIAGEAVSLGAVWCLLTGGEPLLRDDFPELYLKLKRMGLLVSVFTNACLVTPGHVELFRKYPPRDIEVTVYGATEATYERVTRRPGSYDAFVRGLDLLRAGGVKVRLKAMALRSNVHELQEIGQFCRARTSDYYRFDPLLHLRFDGDEARNAEIRAERLSPEEIVAIERADEERFGALQKGCNELILPELAHTGCNHLFHCGTGMGSFAVSYDGRFRLCSSLWHPDTVYDLRRDMTELSDNSDRVPSQGPRSGPLHEAWHEHVPRVRDLRSNRREFLEKCRVCPVINLCLWCPAHSYLETGEMDTVVDYFCKVAHARAKALEPEEDQGKG
jgi:MoaA/NifB/PqqE/SkfB family radical SAM enzyme